MKQIFTILLFYFFFSQLTLAQVFAPDFLCVKGDTLFWELPVNNCGPFNSYDIFASQNESGPYVLLAALNNIAADFYFHPNPSGVQWFYYLQSNHDCPGEMVLSSDTLDNRAPVISPILSASVENGLVDLTWQPSPSPEVFGYIIYRETPLGVVPVDTVFNATSYNDLNALPGTQSESYFVNALDRCGNTSVFDEKHATMFLQGETVPCDQAIALNWNLYQNWPDGIEKQEVFVSENGSPQVLEQTIDGTTNSYNFSVQNDGSTYCFVIRGTAAVSGEFANSNQFCITADVIQLADEAYIQNVSVLPTGEVELTWGWNTDAEISEVQVLRSDMNSNYQVISSENISPPLPPVSNYLDLDVDPAAGNVFYQIQTSNNCGTITPSTYGSSILLQGMTGTNESNQLAWTPLEIENAVASGYDIYKIADGLESLIGTVDGNTNSYIDLPAPGNLPTTQTCYYVVASATVNSPGGNAVTIKSRSNVFCLDQDVRVLVPNAFAPEGFNQAFRPLITFGETAAYEMQVFDRYGQLVFESNDPDDGWRGKYKGKKLPQGVYVYRIVLAQSDGNVIEKKGTVLLLR